MAAGAGAVLAGGSSFHRGERALPYTEGVTCRCTRDSCSKISRNLMKSVSPKRHLQMLAMVIGRTEVNGAVGRIPRGQRAFDLRIV